MSQYGVYWGNEEKDYTLIKPTKSYDETGIEKVASGGEEEGDGREKGLRIIKVGSEDDQSGYDVLIVRLRTDSDNNTNLNNKTPLSVIYFTLNIIPLLKGGEA